MKGFPLSDQVQGVLEEAEFASRGLTFLLRLSLRKSRLLCCRKSIPLSSAQHQSPHGGLEPAFLTLCLWQLPGLETSQGLIPVTGSRGWGTFLYPSPPLRLPALGTHETPPLPRTEQAELGGGAGPHPLRRKGAEESGPGGLGLGGGP